MDHHNHEEGASVNRAVVFLGSLLLLLGAAGSAGAEVLNWEGTSTLLLGDFPRNRNSRGGGVATINGSGALGHVVTLRIAQSRGNIAGNFVQFVTDPETVGNNIAAIEYLELTGTTGTMRPISGALQNTSLALTQSQSGISGTVRLCLFTTDCADPLSLPLQTMNGNVGVGIGGIITVDDGTIKISIQAAPWTIKTATVTDHRTTTDELNRFFQTVKLTGFAHGPASSTSTTGTVNGVVQLVTPSQVTTNLPLGSNKLTGSGQTLLIRFIPEPGLLLLLGAGVAALAVLGKRRVQK
jgi:hypothetical protein